MKEPLGKAEALKRIQEIRLKGSISFSRHAAKELAEDDLTTVDAINVLRCGKITEEAEENDGTYRYRVHTPRMCVVVAFVGAKLELTIVTAWRKKR